MSVIEAGIELEQLIDVVEKAVLSCPNLRSNHILVGNKVNHDVREVVAGLEPSINFVIERGTKTGVGEIEILKIKRRRFSSVLVKFEIDNYLQQQTLSLQILSIIRYLKISYGPTTLFALDEFSSDFVHDLEELEVNTIYFTGKSNFDYGRQISIEWLRLYFLRKLIRDVFDYRYPRLQGLKEVAIKGQNNIFDLHLFGGWIVNQLGTQVSFREARGISCTGKLEFFLNIYDRDQLSCEFIFADDSRLQLTVNFADRFDATWRENGEILYESSFDKSSVTDAELIARHYLVGESTANYADSVANAKVLHSLLGALG